MREITKLPSGYKIRVDKAKGICKQEVDKLNTNGLTNHDTVINYLRRIRFIDAIDGYGGYKEGKPVAHIDFDVHLSTQLNLDLEVYIEIENNRVKLGNYVTIYIRDYGKYEEELKLSKYKW